MYQRADITAQAARHLAITGVNIAATKTSLNKIRSPDIA